MNSTTGRPLPLPDGRSIPKYLQAETSSPAARFAAVTNYREPNPSPGEQSRGKLVTDFLISIDESFEHLRRVQDEADRYAGFNLIVGEINYRRSEIYYFSNRGREIERLKPGVYGLSNHLLNTAWPKLTSGIQQFIEVVSKPAISRDECFKLLANETLAADAELPNTGVGIERERLLSPIFIRTPNYGTRSSTVLLIDNNFRFEFDEKVFA
jgi:uncharacterized protein with NRDE domain